MKRLYKEDEVKEEMIKNKIEINFNKIDDTTNKLLKKKKTLNEAKMLQKKRLSNIKKIIQIK